LNPFEEDKPSIYIADIVVEFKYVFGKSHWFKNFHKTKTVVFERLPLMLQNGEIYSKEEEKRVLEDLFKQIAIKPVPGTLKIKAIQNRKFSSSISYKFK